MKPAHRLLIGLLLSAIVGLAMAERVSVNDLYAAEVRVTSTEPKNRAAGMREAMAVVLAKVSGDARAPARPELGELLRRAGDLAQQFRYRTQPRSDPEAPPLQLLWVRFDKPIIDDALRKAGLRVWGGNRPAVLVWLVTDNGGRRRLLDLERNKESRLALLDQAGVRGVPLRLPLLDLTDKRALAVADLWTLYDSGIRKASERYKAQAVVVGRMQRLQAGLWRARWSMLLPREVVDLGTSEGGELALLRDGVDRAAASLAERFAPVAAGVDATELVWQVNGVEAMEDYAMLARVLTSLASVERSLLQRVDGGALRYRLWVRGGAESLRRELSLQPRLQFQAPAPGAVPAELPELSYQLLP